MLADYKHLLPIDLASRLGMFWSDIWANSLETLQSDFHVNPREIAMGLRSCISSSKVVTV